MRTVPAIATALALSVLSAPHVAGSHTAACRNEPGYIDVLGFLYYANHVLDEYGLLYGYWYAESNGVAGLQRGGSDLIFETRDPCQASSNPDTYLFCDAFGLWIGEGGESALVNCNAHYDWVEILHVAD